MSSLFFPEARLGSLPLIGAAEAKLQPPEEGKDYVCNVLALEPGKIVMLEGSEISQKKLEKEGVDVITVEMSEFIEKERLSATQ